MRAMLQVLYSTRSERMPMERISYNMLFRWFAGLAMDDAVRDASTFSNNRDRLMVRDVLVALVNETVETAHQRLPVGRAFQCGRPAHSHVGRSQAGRESS
ncbi:transposase [Pandoraea sp. SD6-2]|nr:transposase [Pandoraea sp. SD6-2]